MAFADMIDKELWQNLLESLAQATGAYISTLDEHGNQIMVAGRMPLGLQLTWKNYQYRQWQQETATTSIITVEHDPAGFVSIIWPLTVEGKRIACTLISGLCTNIGDLKVVDDIDVRKHQTDIVSTERIENVCRICHILNDFLIPALVQKSDAKRRADESHILLEYLEEIASILDHDALIRESLAFFVKKVRLSNCTLQLPARSYRHQVIAPVLRAYEQVEAIATSHCKSAGGQLVVHGIAQDFTFRNVESIDKLPSSLIAQQFLDGSIYFYSEEDLRSKVHILSQLAQKFARALKNAEQHKSTLHRAITDPLTQIYNRAHFVTSIHKWASECPMSEEYRSICMLDIDDFKKYNDSYGHAEGDRILKDMVNLIQQQLSKKDMFARFGGEEFVIFFTENSLNDAWRKAESIRTSVEKQSKVTISMGLLTAVQVLRSAEEILSAADKALYEAKNAGKNRVVQYAMRPDGLTQPVPPPSYSHD